MAEKFFTLKEVKLNNNCPECYSTEGLHFTFKQKFVENAFYRAITEETTQTMFCTKCETDIFPVCWTDDIERVFEYQKRATDQKPKSIKLKKLSWIIIAINILIVTGIICYITGVFNK
jgi:hypothetical protein